MLNQNISESQSSIFDACTNDTFHLDCTSFFPASWLNWRQKARNHIIFSDVADNDLLWYQQIESAVDKIKEIIKDGIVPSLGVSFGKDSNCYLALLILAHIELKAEGYKPEKPTLVCHADTLIENPIVGKWSIYCWNSLIDFVDKYELPIVMVLAQPNFTQSFLGRVVSGRGLPTVANSSARQCSQDLKIKPMEREVRKVLKAYGIKQSEVCLMIGSRDHEGTLRKNSIRANGGEHSPLVMGKSGSGFVLYAIKHWSTAMVFEFLNFLGTDEKKVFPSFLNNFDRCITIYADSMGECVMFATSDKEAAQSKGCGARHGCTFCVVGAREDKSMEKLLETGNYEYVRQLNRIRNYIINRHHVWEERTAIGRTIDRNGFVKVVPDLYSFQKCRRILHALLTADALEELRAMSVHMEMMAGKIEINEDNVRMSKPQFKMVTKTDLILIEFLYSFHSFSDRPWSALELWHRVYNKGEFELLDKPEDSIYVEPSKQPQESYLFVGGDWTDGGVNLGLRDIAHEAVAFESEGMTQAKLVKNRVTGQQDLHGIMQLAEDESLTVDEEALYWIFEDIEYHLSKQDGYTSVSSAMSLLRSGAISIAKGKATVYHLMSLRQQYYESRGYNRNNTYDELLARMGDELWSRDKYKFVFRKSFEDQEKKKANAKLIRKAKRAGATQAELELLKQELSSPVPEDVHITNLLHSGKIGSDGQLYLF